MEVPCKLFSLSPHTSRMCEVAESSSPMGAFNISSSIEYLRAANDSILTIVQIETKQALENVRGSLGIS